MNSTTPSETHASFSSLLTKAGGLISNPPQQPQTLNVPVAASPSAPASPKASSPPKTRWVILIKSRQTGNFHPVLNVKKGPGVMADFESLEEAVVAQGSVPACQNNESFIIPIE